LRSIKKKNRLIRILEKVVFAFYSFCEALGVLVKEDYLDIRLVVLMWAGTTRKFYENIVEPTIEAHADFLDYPRLWSEAVYLCKEVIKYMEEHPELKT
jgi:hypothetical protein